jgi:hypothetical protein
MRTFGIIILSLGILASAMAFAPPNSGTPVCADVYNLVQCQSGWTVTDQGEYCLGNSNCVADAEWASTATATSGCCVNPSGDQPGGGGGGGGGAASSCSFKAPADIFPEALLRVDVDESGVHPHVDVVLDGSHMDASYGYKVDLISATSSSQNALVSPESGTVAHCDYDCAADHVLVDEFIRNDPNDADGWCADSDIVGVSFDGTFECSQSHTLYFLVQASLECGSTAFDDVTMAKAYYKINIQLDQNYVVNAFGDLVTGETPLKTLSSSSPVLVGFSAISYEHTTVEANGQDQTIGGAQVTEAFSGPAADSSCLSYAAPGGGYDLAGDDVVDNDGCDFSTSITMTRDTQASRDNDNYNGNDGQGLQEDLHDLATGAISYELVLFTQQGASPDYQGESTATDTSGLNVSFTALGGHTGSGGLDKAYGMCSGDITAGTVRNEVNSAIDAADALINLQLSGEIDGTTINSSDDSMSIGCSFKSFQPSVSGVDANDFSPLLYARAYFDATQPSNTVVARRMLRATTKPLKRSSVHTIRVHLK